MCFGQIASDLSETTQQLNTVLGGGGRGEGEAKKRKMLKFARVLQLFWQALEIVLTTSFLQALRAPFKRPFRQLLICHFTLLTCLLYFRRMKNIFPVMKQLIN